MNTTSHIRKCLPACVLGLSLVLMPSALLAKPLKVFVLAGQSNMQGHAHVRTLEHLGMNPETKPVLDDILDKQGQPKKVKDAWISYLTNGGTRTGQLSTGFGANEEKIGPELTFGIQIQKELNEPILIIKTAWGGKSINTDFRSPSAGPYEFKQAQLDRFKQQGKDIARIKADKVKATGHYYREMIAYVQKALSEIGSVVPGYKDSQGYEIAGFVWFQGWNDMVDSGTYPDRDKPGGYSDYSKNLGLFIKDVRKDLKAPELPFVIGVLGVNGPTKDYPPNQRRYMGVHQEFRNGMAATARMPEFRDTVANVFTENYWDQELSRLKDRDDQLAQQVRKMVSEKKITAKDRAKTHDKLRAETFSPRERKLLEVGISNGGYHYLGSSRILTGIGIGFAEAMVKLLEK